MTSPKILSEISDDLSTSAIAVGDVTGSGEPELCTGGRDGVLRLYSTNHSSYKFLAQLDLSGSILSIKIADANNDGQNEIVIGRSVGIGETPGATGTVQIYRYAPSGQFELLAEHAIDRFVTTVVVTDVTGDDKNEIVAGGSDSTLRVLRMSPENQLSEYAKYQLDDMPIAIGTCDVIGDEIDEMVTGNRDKTLRVFKLREGVIEQIEVLELPSPVISVTSGDILGDRKMELGVVTHDGSIRIYRNEESKLDLFSTLEDVKALSIRMEEINADHMDEVIIATSDMKINFYNLYMADLNLVASVDIDSKILALSVGDSRGDERKEVLVGVSNGPLKIIEGLYKVIPSFDIPHSAKIGSPIIAKATLENVTDQPMTGIAGKIYWFPKDHMEISNQQLRFDLEPGEKKTVEVKLLPKKEGSVIIRPVVLMWKDDQEKVNQVTTPETVLLIEKGDGEAFMTSLEEESSEPVESVDSTRTETATKFTPAEGTGFSSIPDSEIAQITSQKSSPQDSLKEAEALLDQLFGGESDAKAALEDVKSMMGSETATESVSTTPEDTTEPEATEVESDLVTEIRTRKPKPTRPNASADAYSYLFKTMVIGEGAVGKTTLVNRYVTGVFERDYKTTIGSQFAVKLTHISPPSSEYAVGIKIQAWDVAGQARFKAVRKMYYSGAAGVILVFDVTRRRSFKELHKWIEEADSSIGTRVPMICVGNKIDLPDRAVSSEEAKKWAEDQGFLYMESSAKTGEGVADMFTVLAELMWREAKKNAEAKKKGM
ncbi:MAG: GTP-binding protein [Candidatus Lokiarchaeota archaeon]|nr:GTP-binding protein [Candidatus Lokiarchaeota archaeon]